MARIVAWSSLDTTRLDLNFYARNFYSEGFLDDEYLSIGGRTYEDIYEINGYNAPVDLILGMLGSGMGITSGGYFTGTVSAIYESTYSGTALWYADRFTVPFDDVMDALLTFREGDDRALLRTILSGDDIIRLSGYADRVEAGSGADTIRAGGGRDVIFGDGGRDKILGNGGNDRLIGGGGADRIDGGANNDRLIGKIGADRLDGGVGRDVLIGGAGGDVFVFSGRFGDDVICDFDPDQRGERIDLRGVSQIDSFRDLRLHHLDRDGDDVVIDPGNGASIRLVDVAAWELSPDDFIF